MKLKELSYAQAGVDRKERDKAKDFSLLQRIQPKDSIRTPFNTLFPLKGTDLYYTFCSDGIGTKVLLAQLAGRHDTIGIDGVAMVVNDVIRCGAKPESMVNAIDIKKSEPLLLQEIIKGINAGALEAECPVIGGETADVPELIKGVSENPYHINFACIGIAEKEKIIYGNNLEKGDLIIGLESNGVHSNGISLVRKVLFKEWNGCYEKAYYSEELKAKVLDEVLKPTKIYVKPVLKAMQKSEVKGAAHITGDAYLKFNKFFPFNPKIGFEFELNKVKPIFLFIQNSAKGIGRKITEEEMLKTFNMGWGFALITAKEKGEQLIKLLEREKINAEKIGKITGRKGRIEVKLKGKKVELK
ncbi:MAG: phosphoribosylformylglycinamidine cyclo-ligase [Candidatus Diapherotrites archaeon]